MYHKCGVLHHCGCTVSCYEHAPPCSRDYCAPCTGFTYSPVGHQGDDCLGVGGQCVRVGQVPAVDASEKVVVMPANSRAVAGSQFAFLRKTESCKTPAKGALVREGFPKTLFKWVGYGKGPLR